MQFGVKEALHSVASTTDSNRMSSPRHVNFHSLVGVGLVSHVQWLRRRQSVSGGGFAGDGNGDTLGNPLHHSGDVPVICQTPAPHTIGKRSATGDDGSDVLGVRANGKESVLVSVC